MPSTELPTGRYLSCPIDLSPDAGGQTRAMLMRNRIFVTEGGIKPTVATFNARTDLPERRAMLLERGMLLPEISTPNIYEHYRNNPWEDEETEPASELPDLCRAHVATEEFFPDGTPFRTVYRSDPSAGLGLRLPPRGRVDVPAGAELRVQGAGDLADRAPAGRAGRLGARRVQVGRPVVQAVRAAPQRRRADLPVRRLAVQRAAPRADARQERARGLRPAQHPRRPAAAVELGRSPTSTAGWSARSTTSTRS